MSNKGNSNSSLSINLNSISFAVICLVAIILLVSAILTAVGVYPDVASILKEIAIVVSILLVALYAWNYVKTLNFGWKLSYFLCILVIVLGFILPWVMPYIKK